MTTVKVGDREYEARNKLEETILKKWNKAIEESRKYGHDYEYKRYLAITDEGLVLRREYPVYDLGNNIGFSIHEMESVIITKELFLSLYDAWVLDNKKENVDIICEDKSLLINVLKDRII